MNIWKLTVEYMWLWIWIFGYVDMDSFDGQCVEMANLLIMLSHLVWEQDRVDHRLY